MPVPSVLHRKIQAVLSMVPTMVGVPLLLRMWTPGWFAVAWLVSYAAAGLWAITVVFGSQSATLERVWSCVLGLWFAAIPLSAVLFRGDRESVAVAILVTVLYIAFEIGSAPTSDLQDWLLASVLAATGAVIAAFWYAPLGPAIAFVILISMTIYNARGLRTVKNELEESYAIANVERERALFHAEHDELTGLRDRRGFSTIWPDYEEHASTVAMFDMNGFKRINDGWGYEVGDDVLQRAAKALRRHLSDDWQLARHGGDEFVAVASGHQTLPDALLENLRCQIVRHGATHQFEFSFSAGVTHGSGDESLDRLLTEAGYALRSAKRTGEPVHYFEGALEARFERALDIGASASQGAVVRSVEPVAQPIVSDSHGIVGWELLARWKRPDGSQMMPSEFLPLLGENGLLPSLTYVMLEKGVQLAAQFDHADAPFIAVNVPASHLAMPGLVERVRALLGDYQIDGSRLMIEITESEQLGTGNAWEATALELAQLGLKLAIDDFGSGYSSIERLSQLPITHLKFDRSMNRSVSGPLGDVLRGVVQFANASGIRVIAEGVETANEWHEMRAIGVDLFQGYHFSRPESLGCVEQRAASQGLKAGYVTA